MIKQVHSVSITVNNVEQSARFFTDLLDFEQVSDVEVAGDEVEHLMGVFGTRLRVITVALGSEQIELMEFIAPQGRPLPVDSRSNDLWFQHIAIVVSDMEAAYARLREHRVRHVSSGPQTLPDWNPNAGGIKAFYFRDQDQHNLELIWFPEGKGSARWQNGEGLFLGIDHTAIAVSDTTASRAFYENLLGFTLAGQSENYGTEQEHLNMVFGAHLQISGLAASDGGMGVEFLEYLSPRTGRPYPVDSKTNDLWHWQTCLVANDVEAAYATLREHGAALISSGLITLSDDQVGPRRTFLIRDPDGHALRIMEQTD
ncbi:MAG: glyoxalase [Chloroflexi bacterium]|nr:glyoxalase [Chloroflexota bacterium]